ncbi:MAG: ISAzo13 family transposase [Dongiaceae bacterium]
MDALQEITSKWNKLMPHLDERQRRLLAAAEARVLGYGGISLVAEASGLSRTTIHKALEELDAPPLPGGYARQPGGGRKRLSEQDPSILTALEELIAPVTRGHPQSPLRWTCKSTRQLAEALSKQGYGVAHRTVADLLQQLGYSLQANAKTIEGKQHADRDAQFQYINRLTKRHLRRKLPAISVDTKKKELVGPYKNGGQEWQPKGQPEPVKTHDFPNPKIGKAIPYGVYDLGRNEGWVNVGCDHDTASFAVESIRRWWRCMGRKVYPEAEQLLISADAGGSNGYRPRLWKVELQQLADETGLKITVCHFPPGTSKWNKVEHRLFAHITMNWRGRPLVSHEVVVNLIGATTTGNGLKVKARLDTAIYPTKIKVSDEDIESVNLKPHKFHGEWNYTISPRT